MGSEPGPPAIAPFDWSGVNGDCTGLHVMLWPSMEPFCAIAEMLQQPKTAASKARWKRAKDLISVMCGRIAENAPADIRAFSFAAVLGKNDYLVLFRLKASK